MHVQIIIIKTLELGKADNFAMHNVHEYLP